MMGTSQVLDGAMNAVPEWTKKQSLHCILTTSHRCYELLNKSVNLTSFNYGLVQGPSESP